MEAGDAELVKALQGNKTCSSAFTGWHGLRMESARSGKILQDMKSQADYVIDTSRLLTRELKEELDRIFVRNENYNSLMVTILSFGFKHGIPADADLVFDVRFLPNPFYIEELKYKTGNDREVQDYVMSFEEARIFSLTS